MRPLRCVIRRLLPLLGWAAQAGCASLTLPPPGQIVGPDAAALPDAGAVVLEDEATLEFRVRRSGGHKRVEAVLDHRRKLKILRPEGCREARVDLALDGWSTVIRLVARSQSADGRINTMGPSSAWIHAREAAGEQAPEVRTLSFEVPGAQVGGVIEYRYQRVYEDAWNLPPWSFGSRLPTVRATFGIVSPQSYRIDFLHGKGDSAVDRVPFKRDAYGDKQRLVFREDDLPAYFAAPRGVHLAHRAPWLAVALRMVRLGGEAHRQESWDDIAWHVSEQMEEVGAEEIQGTTLERLHKIRQALVPMTSPGLGVRRPQKAEALQGGSPACSRDAAAYALAGLGGTGPKARLVLLTSPLAPPFSNNFPAQYPFSSAAVALRVEAGWRQGLQCEGPLWHRDFLCGAAIGDWAYFLPDCPTCPLGVLPAVYAGSRALMVGDNGATRWLTVDIGAPHRHARSTEAHLTMDEAGSVTGNLQAEAHGLPAGEWRADLEALADASAEDEPAAAATAAVHQRNIHGDGLTPKMAGLAVLGLNEVDRGIYAHAQLTAQASRSAGDVYQISLADLAGESIPTSWREARQEAAVLPGPSWHEGLVLLTLPWGTRAKTQPPIKLVHEAAEYAAGYVQHGRTLKWSRRFVIKAGSISLEEWPRFQDFTAQVRAYERAAISLLPPS